MESGVPSEECRRGRDGRRLQLARGVAGRASGDGFRLLNVQPLARGVSPQPESGVPWAAQRFLVE